MWMRKKQCARTVPCGTSEVTGIKLLKVWFDSPIEYVSDFSQIVRLYD